MLGLIFLLSAAAGLAIVDAVDDDNSSSGSSNNNNTDADVIEGTNSDDDITGTAQADFIQAGLGDDTVNGGAGFDTIEGQNGNDHLNGGNGKDVIEGGNGNDFVSGDAFDDILGGGNGNDELFGRNGQDTLLGNAGEDELFGGNGDDRLLGGGSRDMLYGGNGDDVLRGDFQDPGGLASNNVDTSAELLAAINNLEANDPDLLENGTEAEILASPYLQGVDVSFLQNSNTGEFADSLFGGNGDDTLYLGLRDTGNGGEGADSFVLSTGLPSGAPATIEDYQGPDDSIFIQYLTANGNPSIEVNTDGNDALVLADDVVLARVTGAAGTLAADDIRTIEDISQAPKDTIETSGTETNNSNAEQSNTPQTDTQQNTPQTNTQQFVLPTAADGPQFEYLDTLVANGANVDPIFIQNN